VARGAVIRREHLPPPASLGGPTPLSSDKLAQSEISHWTLGAVGELGSAGDPQLYERFLQMVEPPLLEAVLKHCHVNRAAAAHLLGLHRATLRQKMRRYRLGDERQED
jgi:two-component system nitrogen regulation response regulator GlnG